MSKEKNSKKKERIKLSEINCDPPANADKDKHHEEALKFQLDIVDLQRMLYAQGKKSLLVVFQGMDAAGKSGAIRETFSRVNPMGCRVYPFKKPTEEEMAHDFLWRVHKLVPQDGMIHVFDRSHYEDVLIQRVHKWIDMDRVKRRYVHINNFERLLIEENGTAIIKFYLHISPEEQLTRLTERMTNPIKMWKYNRADFEERTRWKEYAEAYEDAFDQCSVHAPWHIIPSNSNWYKEYLVARKIKETLEGMNLSYPPMRLDG